MGVKVKVCGLTDAEDALFAAEVGADYLGFVLYPKSPRFVPPDRAASILKRLPEGVKKVAVVVNAEPEFLKRLLDAGFDLLQLHGDEDPSILKEVPASRVIKAFRVKGELDEALLKSWRGVHAYLLDAYKKGAYGGTGETFDWSVARRLVERGYRIFLSGGLKPETVERAVSEVCPYAVDASSGLEREKGKKDPRKVELFVKRAKGVSCG
ncbi:MAG: phosphoribosylanthranilate isomerase [Aquificae bacterium]|nr:phosphoribosylanthranilate isomerase [Aquificota bacterium]